MPVLGIDPDVVPISNSEISTYMDCRRKWWLSYYRGLSAKKEKQLGPLALGTRIHTCLELYYNDGVPPTETHARLIGELRQEFIARGDDLAALDKEAELGRIMMEGYIPWLEETGADSQIEVIGAEKKLSTPLLDGKVELRGKVDLRIRRRADDARLFVDFKTAQAFNTLTDIAHLNWQIKMYTLLERMTEDDHPVDGARYRMIKKVKRSATAKPPFYLDYDVRHSDATIDSFWYSIHGAVMSMMETRRRLDSGESHLSAAWPTPTNDCTWKCPFFHQCQMFDNGEPVEEFVDEVFAQRDPYARYEE